VHWARRWRPCCPGDDPDVEPRAQGFFFGGQKYECAAQIIIYNMLADIWDQMGSSCVAKIRPNECTQCHIKCRLDGITLMIYCEPCNLSIQSPRTIADRKRVMELPRVFDGRIHRYLCSICWDFKNHTGCNVYNACALCRYIYTRDRAHVNYCIWAARKVFGRDIGGIVVAHLARL
jgi:hypothetical protein